MSFFSANTVALTIWGYPISHLELWGTLFNLWSVWLMARKKILTWPTGIIGVVFLFLLFYQIQLYADMIENAYYFVTGFYGWWLWTSHKKNEETKALPVRFSGIYSLVGWALFSLAGGWAAAQLLSHVHQWWPKYFPEPQSYALVDATTTVMSLVAQILMAHRRTECWIYWLIVDVFGVWLYWQKHTVFLTVEYVIFLVMASYGLWNWLREAKRGLPHEPLEAVAEAPHASVDV